MSDYERIAAAIEFIRQQPVAGGAPRPTLAQIAEHVHLSEFHFQRLFSRWTGVSPKKYMQLLTLERAKHLLNESAGSQLAVAHELGLSSASRLYDQFITIEAVTPEQFKTRGRGLSIDYDVQMTPYGWCFAAITERGICRIEFMDNESDSGPLANLQILWPEALITRNEPRLTIVFDVLHQPGAKPNKPLSLWVKGTNFQLNVWRALLTLQSGAVSSYQTIGQAIGKPSASRAIGSAVGANPVALFIPCHRVLRGDGELGGYRWGTVRKQAILAREFAAHDDKDAKHE